MMEDDVYLEYDLPKYLQISLTAWKKNLAEFENGRRPSFWDCDFCCLQSDINCAEVDQAISSAQANYLRKKYLYK